MKLHSETRLIHHQIKSDSTHKPITESWIPATIFQHPEQGLDPASYNYTRANNPNRAELESVLASIEEGSSALAFASGIAAIYAVLENLPKDAFIIAQSDIYHGTRALLDSMSAKGTFSVQYADLRDLETLSSLQKLNPDLVWSETPSNPMLHIVDIAKVRASIPDSAILVVDNTWMTPLLQKPLLLGADVVVHSTTKYMGGHSDLLGGAVVFKNQNDFSIAVSGYQKMAGAVPSTFDCWLLMRSLKSLHVRLERACSNASRLARWLKDHEEVKTVYFPEFMELPVGQMSGFGAMISFETRGNPERALKIVSNSSIIQRATSLGGVESCWEHRLSTEQWKTLNARHFD